MTQPLLARALLLITPLACWVSATPALAQPCVHKHNEFLQVQASDGETGDLFGISMDMNDRWIVVGTYRDVSVPPPAGGSFYVFDASTGEEIVEFRPSSDASNSFGFSLAVYESTVLAGQPTDSTAGPNVGSVLLYDIPTQEVVGQLIPDDISLGSAFGSSIDVFGAYAAIGAPGHNNLIGAVYLFDLKTGTQIARISPKDAPAFTLLGIRVALNGDRLLASSPSGTTPNGNLLPALVYIYDITDPSNAALLHTIDLGRTFTSGLSIFGDNYLVGDTVSVDDVFNSSSPGQVHIHDWTTGQRLRTIEPLNQTNNQRIGSECLLINDSVIIADVENNQFGEYSGAVYIHDLDSGRQIGILSPSTTQPNHVFGFQLAQYGSTVGVSAIGSLKDIPGGAVYLFDLESLPCPEDFTCDGILDTADIIAFVDNFALQSERTDYTADGIFNIFDVFAFIEAFNAGCP